MELLADFIAIGSSLFKIAVLLKQKRLCEQISEVLSSICHKALLLHDVSFCLAHHRLSIHVAPLLLFGATAGLARFFSSIVLFCIA